MESDDKMKTLRKRLTSSIEFLRLKRIEDDFITVILQNYGAYVPETQEQAKKLLDDDNFATQSIVPTSLKFCVDSIHAKFQASLYPQSI